MTTSSSAFSDVSASSEHYSLQRFLAGMFPDTEIRRRFVEGAFTERPFMLVTMVSHSTPRYNSYVAYPIIDFMIAYYASDFSDAQNALDKLSSLAWKSNRIPIWDYSDVETPSATEDHLRVQSATCQLMVDLDDTELHNVMCDMTVEGKRSFSRIPDTVVIESVEIGAI
jgi:hypothetical protein